MQVLVTRGGNTKISIFTIEPWRSGFSLKADVSKNYGYDVDSFTLSCNGKLIKDDVSLDNQGIKKGSTINIHVTGKGGVHKFTILFWLALIIYAAVLFLLLGTGVFNMIAYLYAYLFKNATDNIFQWVFSLLGNDGLISCLKIPLSWFIMALNFVVKHSIVFLFVFVAIAALSYPIFGIWYKDHCQSLFLSKKVGVISAVIYIFIYGLLYVPNILYNAAMTLTSLSGTTKVLVTPALQAQKNAVDDAKYLGFYAIPFFGAGIEQTQYILSQIIEKIYNGTEMFNGIECTKAAIDRVDKELGKVVACTRQRTKGKSDTVTSCVGNTTLPMVGLRTCDVYDGLVTAIQNNKMQDMLEFAWIGLNDAKYKQLETAYKNAGFFTKIDILGLTKIGNCYFNATASRWLLCAMLKGLNDTDDYFNYVGNNVDSVIDTMKRGNIAGLFTAAGYVVIMVIAMIFPSFLGYL